MIIQFHPSLHASFHSAFLLFFSASFLLCFCVSICALHPHFLTLHSHNSHSISIIFLSIWFYLILVSFSILFVSFCLSGIWSLSCFRLSFLRLAWSFNICLVHFSLESHLPISLILSFNLQQVLQVSFLFLSIYLYSITSIFRSNLFRKSKPPKHAQVHHKTLTKSTEFTTSSPLQTHWGLFQYNSAENEALWRALDVSSHKTFNKGVLKLANGAPKDNLAAFGFNFLSVWKRNPWFRLTSMSNVSQHAQLEVTRATIHPRSQLRPKHLRLASKNNSKRRKAAPIQPLPSQTDMSRKSPPCSCRDARTWTPTMKPQLGAHKDASWRIEWSQRTGIWVSSMRKGFPQRAWKGKWWKKSGKLVEKACRLFIRHVYDIQLE